MSKTIAATKGKRLKLEFFLILAEVLLWLYDINDLFALFYSIFQIDFGAAFAGSGGVVFVVVDYTKMTFSYHFITPFYISSSARA